MRHPNLIETQLHNRKKNGPGVRPWLLLDSTGRKQVMEVGKHSIMRRTGLSAHDIRVLDPFLSYPCAILSRERAIVINLERIKAIIMANGILILNYKDPFVEPLIQELEKRILCYCQATKEQDDSNGRSFEEPQEQQNLMQQPPVTSSKKISISEGFSEFEEKERKSETKYSFRNQDIRSSNLLPFEFVALEACIEATCTSLDNEAKTLEQEVCPALDDLTSKINTHNLKRVRLTKGRLIEILGRIQRVRDELEQLLDNDDDMAEMHLTDKLSDQQYFADFSTPSTNKEEGDHNFDYEVPDMDDRFAPLEVIQEDYKASDIEKSSVDDENSSRNILISASAGRDSFRTTRSSYKIKNSNVGELEMLLEVYFTQIDGTLNRLSGLREYVNDTEDYINIILDDKQNHLLQMGIFLTIAALFISGAIVVSSCFGMNVRVALFNEDVRTGMPKWLWTVGGCCFSTFSMIVMVIAWCKHKGLLE